MYILKGQILSTVLALLGVLLATRQSTLKWPLGILANIIALFIYKKTNLYIKAAFSGIFIINSCYGWYNWLYGGKNNTPLMVTRTKTKSLILLLAIGIFFSILLGEIEKQITGTQISYWEAFASFSLVAHWMMVKKKLENWIIWIILDGVYIGVCIYKGLYVFAFKYLIYMIIAIKGYFSWRKSYINK